MLTVQINASDQRALWRPLSQHVVSYCRDMGEVHGATPPFPQPAHQQLEHRACKGQETGAALGPKSAFTRCSPSRSRFPIRWCH